MSYLNDTDANVAHLAAQSGLAPSVIRAWLRCERQSVKNITNPLNIRYYGSTGQHLGPGANGKPGVGFAAYDSAFAGLNAVAWLIRNLPAYAGIRAAIKGGQPNTEAMAIEASPWAAGHYGGGGSRQGCISGQIPDSTIHYGPKLTLHIHDRTAVYDHPGGSVIGHIGLASYQAQMADTDGGHWYFIEEGPWAHHWVPAEPWETTSPL